MTEGLDVQPARLDESPLVLVLLNEAAAWLIGRGIQQWEPGQWRPERIAASIAREETYLMWADHAAVATVSLEWRDEVMWPSERVDAGYVHRLAVATAEHYERAGYSHRGDRTVRGRAGPEFCGSRYEKELV